MKFLVSVYHHLRRSTNQKIIIDRMNDLINVNQVGFIDCKYWSRFTTNIRTIIIHHDLTSASIPHLPRYTNEKGNNC